MNLVKTLLVELVAIAESPLYSAYRWIGKRLGQDVSPKEFLREVELLIQTEVLRLWHVDESYDRTELFEVPPGLLERYQEADHSDETYDPFGYSLTLGPRAEVESEPAWRIDIDFRDGTFELLTEAPDVNPDEAVAELARLYPDLAVVPVRVVPVGQGRRVFGKVSSASGHEADSH